MKTLVLIALFFAASTMAGPDRGVRAFLGLRSAGTTLTAVKREVIHVYALARIEKGQFVKFECLSNGHLSPLKDATFELVWGQRNGQHGYALVAGDALHDFKAEPIFEKFVFTGGQAKGEYKATIHLATEYKGMKVLAGAFSSQPKDPVPFFNQAAKVEHSLADVDCAMLILFKECQSTEESLDFMRKLKLQNDKRSE